MENKLTELAKSFFDCKKSHDDLTEKLKEVEKNWQDVETQMLDAMIEEGVNSISIEGCGQFSMRTKNYLSVNAANKEKFFEYLKESGNGHLLKLDVNPRTLTAFLAEHMEGLVETAQKEGLDIVDARDKALKFLNDKGANYFTKRDIALRAK